MSSFELDTVLGPLSLPGSEFPSGIHDLLTVLSVHRIEDEDSAFFRRNQNTSEYVWKINAPSNQVDMWLSSED